MKKTKATKRRLRKMETIWDGFTRRDGWDRKLEKPKRLQKLKPNGWPKDSKPMEPWDKP
jgi:hypothetical protein